MSPRPAALVLLLPLLPLLLVVVVVVTSTVTREPWRRPGEAARWAEGQVSADRGDQWPKEAIGRVKGKRKEREEGKNKTFFTFAFFSKREKGRRKGREKRQRGSGLVCFRWWTSSSPPRGCL